MKTLVLTVSLVLFSYSIQAQYCSSDIRPDYKEMITHSFDSKYKPCQSQSRKAWFYVQQQRIENRMEKLLAKHRSQIQALASTYADYVKQYYNWDYTSPEQFKRGINFLFNMDTTIDEIETGQAKF